MSSKSRLSYADRAARHPNPVARRLFEIAESKKTNVTVSADLTTTGALLEIADRMWPEDPLCCESVVLLLKFCSSSASHF